MCKYHVYVIILILYIPLLLPEYTAVRPLALKHGPNETPVSIIQRNKNILTLSTKKKLYVNLSLSMHKTVYR